MVKRPDNYHPKLYLPSKNRKTINVINDHEYDLTFKSYCLALELLSNNNMIGAASALGCKNPMDEKEFNMIWKIIHEERWKSTATDYKKLGLSDEDIAEILKAEEDFDMLKDFDAYAPDFIDVYNIDLYDNDMELFKFFDLLFALMSSSSTCISRRRKTRNSKYDKDAGVSYNVAMQQLKEQYSL